MAETNKTFVIDDKLSTSDNLTAYVKALEGIDSTLASALSGYLAPLAAGQSIESSSIWDALFKALNRVDPGAAGSGESDQ